MRNRVWQWIETFQRLLWSTSDNGKLEKQSSWLSSSTCDMNSIYLNQLYRVTYFFSFASLWKRRILFYRTVTFLFFISVRKKKNFELFLLSSFPFLLLKKMLEGGLSWRMVYAGQIKNSHAERIPIVDVQ